MKFLPHNKADKVDEARKVDKMSNTSMSSGAVDRQIKKEIPYTDIENESSQSNIKPELTLIDEYEQVDLDLIDQEDKQHKTAMS